VGRYKGVEVTSIHRGGEVGEEDRVPLFTEMASFLHEEGWGREQATGCVSKARAYGGD
jgi:hypothetical protein